MTTGTGEALVLMQRALALLDTEGETRAAAHLQGAIDAARREQPLGPGEELDAAFADLVDESSQAKPDP